ncbi:hypothetical protein PMAYCL1PPCAC_06204 [Pristionchus mayeri]|uniref:CX domain-containing protein n=1 Tax=Pristionchus mayeri TaxID=1317129 RepID=A0AAN4Z9U5_9BILA|nr:hypothetical protein PMAYCL1PPCAC_06204 [Pristionchus mayeri]
MVSRRLLFFFLIIIILLYDAVESKRSGGRSSSSRGSSGSRSSSRNGSSSSGSKSSWFGSGSSSRSSSSSSSSSWGSGSSSSRSHSGGSFGGSSRPRHYYGSIGRGWSNRYYGNNIVVLRTHTYYRGGGYGGVYSSRGSSVSPVSSAATQPPVETPTVTTDMIKDVLFPGDPRKPSKEIFDFDESAFRMRFRDGFAENFIDELRTSMDDIKGFDLKDDNSLTKLQRLAGALSHDREMKDEEASIKGEELPVIVTSIPYFWREANLPQGDNETDCVDFSAVNDASNFTICNVTAMIRCQKSLSDVILVGKDRQYSYSKKGDAKIILKNGNGSLVDDFAWFCPPSDKCCEWECCSTEEKEHTEFDPPDDDFVSAIHTVIVLSVMGGLMALCCGCCYYMNREDKTAQTGRRTQQQRQQQSVEMEPLTAPYPS